MALNVGDPAPDFSMPTADGGTVSLSDLRGKKVVLYFYPKDDTPGCTVEACAFRDNFPNFQNVNAEIIGVSRDDTESHQRFRDKFGLNFTLASDTTGEVTEAYGVWTEKNMYGKTFMGIQRATFLIDEDGNIAHVWPRVSVDGHADEVMAAIKGEPLPGKAAAENSDRSEVFMPAKRGAANKKPRKAAASKRGTAKKPRKAATSKRAAAKKKAPAKAAEKTARKSARKTARKSAKTSARKTVKASAKKAGRKTAKRSAKKSVKASRAKTSGRKAPAKRKATRKVAKRKAGRR